MATKKKTSKTTDKLRKEFGLDAEEMQKQADSFNRPKP